MNKLLVVLFGLVVAVHSFSIPVSRNSLLEHSFHVESPSLGDSPLKESSAEYSHAEVLPLENSHSEEQPAESQPSENSQVEESHQEESNQADQSSEAKESHQEESNQADQNSEAKESHQEESNQADQNSEAKESHQEESNQADQSSEAKESHQEESNQADQNSEAKESHSEDKPAESSPVDDSQSESHLAENPLATELPEEDLYEENSPAQDGDKYEDDSSHKEEEKNDEEEEKDDDLPEDYYDDQELKAVSNGLYRFSSEFYKKTAATRTRNLVCSPLSVGVLLAMTAQGARGLTEKEMRKGLHLPEDSLVGRNGYQSLIDSLNAEKKAEVHLANAVFMNDEIEMVPEFESLTHDYFRSPVEKVPFYFPDEASEVINYWVEERTQGKVKNVVKPEDAFDSEMILVNAIYFKGQWQSRFEKENTEVKFFNIDNKQYKKVPTMYQKNTFNYGVLPHLKSVYVELPYEHLDEDDELSMFIVLPNEVTGLKKLINASEKIDFQALHNSPQLTNVKLYLPKFKVRSTLNLQSVLENMGMRDMFRYKANFTGITKSRHLSLSKVVQKAYLEVNEEGSEATAATAGVLNVLSASNHQQEPVEVHVDHPFMYVIYHSATNTVLFQGHVKAPALR